MPNTITIHTSACGRTARVADERNSCACYVVYLYAAPQERTLGNGLFIDHRLPLRSQNAITLEDAEEIARRWMRQADVLLDEGFIGRGIRKATY